MLRQIGYNIFTEEECSCSRVKNMKLFISSASNHPMYESAHVDEVLFTDYCSAKSSINKPKGTQTSDSRYSIVNS
jgi:hypothetical protein